MAGFDKWEIDEPRATSPKALKPHQLEAAAAPHMPLKQLARQSAAPRDPSGNFNDLDFLLQQLGAPPVFELGKPLPQEKFLLRMRVGSCPAAHNRALLDDGD
jgi:hypothetical protein